MMMNSSPLRSNSRRKQRQFENRTFQDASDHYHISSDDREFYIDHDTNFLLLKPSADIENKPLTRKSLRNSFPFYSEWRSAFSPLFTSENSDALEIFRLCGDVLILKQKKYESAVQKKTVAESSWLGVEKRVRHALKNTVERNPRLILPFLVEFEKTLLDFYLHRDLYTADDVEILLQSFSQQSNCAFEITVDDELKLYLQENSFLRLIVHGVCQFYGLKSKTVDLSPEEDQPKCREMIAHKKKAMIITVNRGRISPAASNRISLAEYLLMTTTKPTVATEERELKRTKFFAEGNATGEGIKNVEKVTEELKCISLENATTMGLEVEEAEGFVLVN